MIEKDFAVECDANISTAARFCQIIDNRCAANAQAFGDITLVQTVVIISPSRFDNGIILPRNTSRQGMSRFGFGAIRSHDWFSRIGSQPSLCLVIVGRDMRFLGVCRSKRFWDEMQLWLSPDLEECGFPSGRVRGWHQSTLARSGNNSASPSGIALQTPRSVISPVTSLFGVTSKAGLPPSVPSGVT